MDLYGSYSGILIGFNGILWVSSHEIDLKVFDESFHEP